nr:hypothetical protein [Bradyrhizobium manausense]
MDADRDAASDDLAPLKEGLAAERLEIATELAIDRAKASQDEALIAQQRLRSPS